MGTQCRFDLSGMCPVRTPEGVPPPPYTPLGYKFSLKPCRLFLTRLKSMPVDKILAQILPHREIGPLKITGKSGFLPKKQLRIIAPEPLRWWSLPPMIPAESESLPKDRPWREISPGFARRLAPEVEWRFAQTRRRPSAGPMRQTMQCVSS